MTDCLPHGFENQPSGICDATFYLDSPVSHITRDDDFGHAKDINMMSDDKLFRWNFTLTLACKACAGASFVEEAITAEIFCTLCGIQRLNTEAFQRLMM